jgi:hypothetical protein
MPFFEDRSLKNKRNKTAEEVAIEKDISEMMKQKSNG